MELNHRTDMNLKGRMIEELEQIPNVIENIALIPTVDKQLKLLENKLNKVEERLVLIDNKFVVNKNDIKTINNNLKDQSDFSDLMNKSINNFTEQFL